MSLRWLIEQTYRELKQDLGLDKYEGRKWQGFAHHVSVVLSCYAFLVAEREGVFPPGAKNGQRRRQALPFESASPGAHR